MVVLDLDAPQAYGSSMELNGEVIINAPAHAAWAVLGICWGHIGRWAAPITASSLDGEPCAGAVRTCHIARFGPVPPGIIKERLLAFDSDAMSFAYESIEGMPRFIEGAVNRWSVHALGDGQCVVRSRATVRLRGPMVLLGFLLERSFRANGARVLDELRHRVEHGSPHPRKVAAMERDPVAPGVPSHGTGVC